MNLKKQWERKIRVRVLLNALRSIFPSAGCVLNYFTPWELLVAVILSSQCTDKKVNEVTAVLFKKYRRIADYLRANPQEFERDIKQTEFFRNKTKSILTTAKIIHERLSRQSAKFNA